MGGRMSGTLIRASVFAGALVLAQAASAGRVILNNDEWTLSNYAFASAPTSTTAFAQNLAAYMNVNGGACNLLVYSVVFGLTGSSLNNAFTSAGCTVTYSTGAFDLATLSNYDGVLLGDHPMNYDADVLTAYVNAGGSAYIAGGTALANEGAIWNQFAQNFGLDFSADYNNIAGWMPIDGSNPLLTGVTQLYYNTGNDVSTVGGNSNAQIIAFDGNHGLIGVFDDTQRVSSQDAVLAVPEPATLSLMSAGLLAIGLRRRRRH
jgi:hypothetical protein